VRVVTDSSALVPHQWVEAYPLEIVPSQLAWPDGTTIDGDPPYSELPDDLARRGPPTTAAPSPGAYGDLFERMLATADALLVITPPTDLSTTFSSASLAARSMGDERVRVLDARTAAAGQGIVAGEAARSAASPSATLDGVCDVALRAASHTQIWATLAQLDSLRRSGRLPAIAAIGAGALHLQPIVRYAGGKPTPVGVARSAHRACERLLKAWERTVGPARDLRFVVFHSARDEEAQMVVDRVRERVPRAETYIVPVTASLAAHTGPGLLGLAWLWV